MANTYTTKQGDTWDSIAFEVYGEERYAGWLMQNNFKNLDTFVFSAGVVLQAPDLPKDDTSSTVPIWRTEHDYA